MDTFFANGKLLLTGEYVVLDGALSIGLPTKQGQHLSVSELPVTEPIRWEAKYNDGKRWVYAEISSSDFSILTTDNQEVAQRIAEILFQVSLLNPNIFQDNSFHFETQLDFPSDWGLGSSSTLIALLSKFADIDGFKLLENTFGGSGYDMSCAILPKPQTYQLTKKDRKISFVQLHPDITQYLYFVYLNQKQNSREGIAMYRSIEQSERLIKSISDISKEVISCDNLMEFEDLMFVHETLLSNHLQIPTVQDKLFSDYKEGVVKSLGAWGGDFVLVSNMKNDLSYFEQKGYTTIISYHDMVVD